jgi:hypothetical protein
VSGVSRFQKRARSRTNLVDVISKESNRPGLTVSGLRCKASSLQHFIRFRQLERNLLSAMLDDFSVIQASAAE